MKNGVALITKERLKQIDKYGFTAEHHAEHPELYENHQLQQCAISLLIEEIEEQPEFENWIPEGWNKEWFLKMCRKPLMERLIIAGALIASEIDRIEKLNESK